MKRKKLTSKNRIYNLGIHPIAKRVRYDDAYIFADSTLTDYLRDHDFSFHPFSTIRVGDYVGSITDRRARAGDVGVTGYFDDDGITIFPESRLIRTLDDYIRNNPYPQIDDPRRNESLLRQVRIFYPEEFKK